MSKKSASGEADFDAYRFFKYSSAEFFELCFGWPEQGQGTNSEYCEPGFPAGRRVVILDYASLTLFDKFTKCMSVINEHGRGCRQGHAVTCFK